MRSSVFSHRLHSSMMPTRKLPMQPMGDGSVRICARSSVSAARSMIILPPTVQRKIAITVRNKATLSRNVPLGLYIVKLLLIRLQCTILLLQGCPQFLL